MTSVVLDTNVLASGFAGFLNLASTPGQLLHAWQGRQFELVVSEHIVGEVAHAFEDPYFRRRMTPEQISAAQSLLRRQATLTVITVQVQGIATHPEDDLVLSTAVSARVDYLVSGDGKLRRLGSYQGVRIVSPRQFLEEIQTQEVERG